MFDCPRDQSSVLFSPSISLLSSVASNVIHVFITLICPFPDQINQIQEGATDKPPPTQPFHQYTYSHESSTRTNSMLVISITWDTTRSLTFQILPHLSYANSHMALLIPSSSLFFYPVSTFETIFLCFSLSVSFTGNLALP